MTKTIAKVLKKSDLPALVVANGENLTDIIFRPFNLVVANNEETVALLGGGEKDMHSPIDGERIEPKEGVSETASNAEDLAKSFVVVAHCTECDHDTYATKELAVKLDGVDMCCMNCGKEVAAEYSGDFAEEFAAEDEEDPDSLDLEDDDTTSEEDEEDVSEDEGDSEEDITDAVEEDEESTEDEGDSEEEPVEEEDASAEDVSTETTEEVTAEETQEEVPEAPVTEVEVVTAKVADLDSEIRVVQASTKRYEVFAGDVHLGHLNLDLATSNVANLASNDQAFRRSVIMTVAQNLAEVQKTGKVTEDLNNFGMTLAEVTVPVSEAVDKMVAEQVAETTQKLETEAAEKEEATAKAFEIAMAGLNKGVLKGPNYVEAFAKVLTRFGIKNAQEEAAKVVEETGAKFVKTAQELAANIVKEGPDYARGLSTTIASVKTQSEIPVEDPSLATAAVFNLRPNKVEKPSPGKEIASNEDRSMRYRSLFRNLR